MKYLAIIVLFISSLAYSQQVIDLSGETAIWGGQVINLNGVSGGEEEPTTWPELMLASYLSINSHIEYTQAQQDTILARLSKPHIVNYFGPDSLNKEICDFFLYFEHTPGAVTQRSNTKTDSILDWDYGYAIYHQNNLPAQNTTGVITVTSEDSFSGWGLVNLNGNNFIGDIPNFSHIEPSSATTYYLYNDNFDITWPDTWTGKIRYIYFYGNTATTTPSITDASELQIIKGYGTGISSYRSITYDPTSIREIDYSDNNMSNAEIMKLLYDLDGMVGVISRDLDIDLSGSDMGCLDATDSLVLTSIENKYTAASHTFTYALNNGCSEEESLQMIFDTVGFDNPADALAVYWDSTGITDPDIQSQLEWWGDSLVADGLWNLQNAIYPMLGGTAQSQKFDLKNPSGNYNLTYGGSVTHSSTGMTGDGTTGYASTNYYADSLQGYNASLIFYSGTDYYDGVRRYDIGVVDADGDYFNFSAGSPVDGEQMIYARDYDKIMYHPYDNTQGLFHLTVDTAKTSWYIDGYKALMSNNIYDSLAHLPIYLMSQNSNGSAYNLSKRELRLAVIAKNFTDYQAYKYAKHTNALLDSLNRKISVNRHTDWSVSEDLLSVILPSEQYTPVTESDTSTELIDTSDVGILFCFNIESFASWDFTGYAPSPFNFSISDVDVDSWIEAIDTIGVDYALITLSWAHGFGLDTLAPLPEALVNAFSPYVHYDVSVNHMMDQDVIGKFKTACESRGIPWGFYFNPMRDFNTQPFSGKAWIAYDSTQAFIKENWIAHNLQLMELEHDPDLWWIDGWATEHLTNDELRVTVKPQNIYNAIKEADNTSTVIWNHLSDTGFVRFPYDVGSTEELAFTHDDIDVADTNRYSSGTQYYIPQEFIFSPAEGAVWFCTSDEGVVVRSTASAQIFVDRAATVGAKINMAIIIDRDGNVQTEQIELFNALDFSGF